MRYKRRQRSFKTIRMPSKDTLIKVATTFMICISILLLSWILNILSTKPLVIAIGQKVAMWGKTSIHQNSVVKYVFPPSQSVISYIDGKSQIISDNTIVDTMLKEMPLVNALKDKLSNTNAASAANQDNITAQKEAPIEEHQNATNIDGEVFPIEEITISPTSSSGLVTGGKL